MPEDPEAAARALMSEQEAEWGEYVAVEPIDIGGARAFNPGDPVPRDHVKRGVVSKDSVARHDTKAAKAVTGTES